MIGYHCGERVVTISNNPVYFKVKCMKCLRVFKQHKRQPSRAKRQAALRKQFEELRAKKGGI